MSNYEWQMVGTDHWVYGQKIRGMVRKYLAEIYYDEDVSDWLWIAYEPAFGDKVERGAVDTRSQAIWAAEKSLGVVEGDD